MKTRKEVQRYRDQLTKILRELERGYENPDRELVYDHPEARAYIKALDWVLMPSKARMEQIERRLEKEKCQKN